MTKYKFILQDGRAQHFGAQSHDFKMHIFWKKGGIFITFVDLFFFWVAALSAVKTQLIRFGFELDLLTLN